MISGRCGPPDKDAFLDAASITFARAARGVTPIRDVTDRVHALVLAPS